MTTKWTILVFALALVSFSSSTFGETVTHDDLIGGDAPADLFYLTDKFSSFRPDSVVDHLFENSWFYRVNGVSTSEVMLVPDVVASALNTFTFTGNEGNFFNWTLTATLLDGPGPNRASVAQNLVVTNISEGALDLSLFNYTDYDLNENVLDTGELIAPGIIRYTDTNGSTTGDAVGVATDAFEVDTFGALRGRLEDAAINNLNNTGLPFTPAADMTSAFQWNRTFVPDETQTFAAALNVVPEPTSGALALMGLAALVGVRRRLRR